MDRESIEVTRTDRIYCLKVSSDYHPEVCEECKFYPNCDHMTQDDMTELTIRDLEKLDKIKWLVNDDWLCKCRPYHILRMVREVLENEQNNTINDIIT